MNWDVIIDEEKYTVEADKSWEAKGLAVELHKQKHGITTPSSYLAYGAKVKRHEDRRFRYTDPVTGRIGPAI